MAIMASGVIAIMATICAFTVVALKICANTEIGRGKTRP